MSNTDHWINSNQVFVHYGQCYGVTKTGSTVCLGEEKDIVDTSMPVIIEARFTKIKRVRSRQTRGARG